ncbi:MAG: RNA-binding S4 domain-containing protein [Deferrisomatales bacterium]
MADLTVSISTEFIRLDQFLKLADLAQGGGEAKLRVQAGEVRVNGEAELRRGRKLRPGDVVELDGARVRLAAEGP